MVSMTRRRRRLLLAAIPLAMLLSGGWMLLRDSSLVAVRDVTIVGVHGRQAEEISSALTQAARDQTTLHIRESELMKAAEPYPVIHSLRAERDLLHGMKIRVNSYDPVAAVETGSGRVAVAADGTLLRGSSTEGLPRLKLKTLDAGNRLSDPEGMRAVRLLAAAPPALRERVQRVFRSRRGLSTTMRKGPKLYFGGDGRYAAKWAAAAKVLSDSDSFGASYIDLRLPDRPTAGGLPPLPTEPKLEAVPADPTTAPPETVTPTG